MGVVCLPCGEKHGYTGDQSCEDTSWRRAKTHRSHLAKAGERAIQGVNAMTGRISTCSQEICMATKGIRTQKAPQVHSIALSAGPAFHHNCPSFDT